MEVKFEVKMTQKIMYDFLMNHTLRSVSGIVGILFGLIALIVFITTLGKVEVTMSIIYFIFGIWFLLYLPVALYLRSAKQVKSNPIFQNPLGYVINDKGIQTIQEKQKARIEWESILKITQTQKSLLVYTGRRYSFVLPLENIGSQYDTLMKLMKRHLPAGKIKIKQG